MHVNVRATEKLPHDILETVVDICSRKLSCIAVSFDFTKNAQGEHKILKLGQMPPPPPTAPLKKKPLYIDLKEQKELEAG